MLTYALTYAQAMETRAPEDANYMPSWSFFRGQVVPAQLPRMLTHADIC